MIHLIAVILTLFPGFGLGYALLGRRKTALAHCLICLALGSLIPLALVFGPPPIPAWGAFIVFPLLLWNLFHSHFLWIKNPAE